MRRERGIRPCASGGPLWLKWGLPELARNGARKWGLNLPEMGEGGIDELKREREDPRKGIIVAALSSRHQKL